MPMKLRGTSGLMIASLEGDRVDDYKRGLYMQVLRELKSHTEYEDWFFTCNKLRRQLVLEGVDCAFRVQERSPGILKEFFPEFYQLYDGTYWDQFGGSEFVSEMNAWWSDTWLAPRIRALECILRD